MQKRVECSCIPFVLTLVYSTLFFYQTAGAAHKRFDDQTPSPVTWNIEVFVDTVKELVPNLNWRQVIFDLDHPGFLIKTTDAVRLIILAYLRATNDIFPVEAIYKAWSNTYGQVIFVYGQYSN